MKKIHIILIILFAIHNSIQSQTNCSKTGTSATTDEVYTNTPQYVPPTDTDGDGIFDQVEGITDDCDNDGIPNYLDLDSDNDGIPDQIESMSDLDEDGVMNFCDLDSDGDGINDSIDECYNVAGSNPNGCPELRHIFWIHGYDGAPTSWSKAGNHVQSTYKTQSTFVDYSAHQQNLAAEAQKIESDIISVVGNNTDNQNNFLIAHSGGGVAAREMGQVIDLNSKNAFNGFITFGTPHQGAAAADFLVDEDNLETAINDICTNIGTGPFLLAGDILDLEDYLFWQILSFFPDEICDEVTPTFQGLINEMALLGVENELTVAHVTQNLDPMATQHNAVFYGIETDIDDDTNDIDESLTPRFLGSYIKNANDDYSLWGAGGMDQDGIDNYHFVYSAYDYLRIYYMIKRFIPRLDLGRNLYYHNTYRAFKNGTNFLKDFNSYWKNIIGATSVNIVYDGDCECIIEDQWGEIDYILFDCDDTSFNQQQCDYIHETSNVNIEFKSSDGFILAESAKDAPGMNYEPSFMPGSSHFQMRNDENTRDAMEKIFDNGVNGEFFNTDRR